MDNEDINVQEENQEVDTPLEENEPIENNEQQNNEEDTQLAKLKRRIPYDEDIFGSQTNYEIVLADLLEDSMYIGLSILFPFEDFSNIEFPTRYYNWQIRVCVELYNMAGKTEMVCLGLNSNQDCQEMY